MFAVKSPLAMLCSRLAASRSGELSNIDWQDCATLLIAGKDRHARPAALSTGTVSRVSNKPMSQNLCGRRLEVMIKIVRRRLVKSDTKYSSAWAHSETWCWCSPRNLSTADGNDKPPTRQNATSHSIITWTTFPPVHGISGNDELVDGSAPCTAQAPAHVSRPSRNRRAKIGMQALTTCSISSSLTS